MLRRPPDVLITTPESLFLLLTSPNAREMLRTVETVIVDEIHAVAATKRGTHLALVAGAARRHCRPRRSSASGCRRPSGRSRRSRASRRRPRRSRSSTPAPRKELDLEVVVPVEDMAAPPETRPQSEQAGDPAANRSIWPAIYPRLLELVRRTARRSSSSTTGASPSGSRCGSTSWPASEVARAHHGSLAREARAEIEEELKAGTLRCLVATARWSSASTWAPSTSWCRSSRPARLARPAARRPRRPPGRRRQPRAHLPEVPRRPGRVRRRRASACARARSRRRACRATRSTCSRSRSWRCARSDEWPVDEL